MKNLTALYDAKAGKAPIVILDTDFGIDADDLLDVEVCHKLHDRGDIILAATVGNLSVQTFPRVGPALEAMARAHGNVDVQVGVLPSGGQANIDYYSGFIANNFNPSRQSAHIDTSTNVYRRVLANAPDDSVVIHLVGTMASFKLAYNSVADAISPLTGAQLVARKVKAIICVAGNYPTGSEFNFTQDPTTADVINNLPASIRVIYSGANTADNGADQIMIGKRYATLLPAGYITRQALASISFTGRPAWGTWCLLGYLSGFRTETKLYASLTGPGSNSVNTGNGANTWDGTTVLKNQAYLTRNIDKDDMAAEVEALIYRPPGASDGIGKLNLDPWVELYARSLLASGTKDGPKLRSTLIALNKFVYDLRVSGVWPQLTLIAPLCGENLASAMQLLKYPIRDGSPSMTAVGLTEVDFSQDLGLACMTVGKYANTNNGPTALGMSATSHSLGYYSRTHVQNTSSADMGRYDSATSALQIISHFSGGFPNSYFDTIQSSGAGRLDSGSVLASTTRLIVGTRTAANAAKLFRDNVQLGSTLATSAGSLPANPLFIGTGNTADCPQKRFGLCFAGKALADWQVAVLTQCVNNLETALGRAV